MTELGDISWMTALPVCSPTIMPKAIQTKANTKGLVGIAIHYAQHFADA